MDFLKKYGTWIAVGGIALAAAAVTVVAKFQGASDEELDEYTDVDPNLVTED